MRPPSTLPRTFATLLLAAGLAIFPILSPGNPATTVAFIFQDVDGRPVRLADYRGQWLLVAFWAPWCPLCKIQMPTLKALDSRPDFAVLGVGLDYDSADAVRDAIGRFGLPFRVVAGGARRAPDSPHRQIGPVDYFPTSYLYDPAGEIVMFIPGQVNAGKVEGFIARRRTGPAGAVIQAANTERLAAFVKRQYGQRGEQAYADWRAMVERHAGSADTAKLAAANDFFNRRTLQSSDRRAWGREEYWATLGEVLGQGIGDGEDFAIAKYFTLLAMGVPVERLRLVYVRTQAGAGDPVHMVLAYFEAANREPVLLDNRRTDILPASRRADLKPVFSFNGAGAWGDAHELPGTSGNRLPMWEDTLRRARNEGFD